MDVAVYGGSFNPPHFSHVMAAAYALSVVADLVVVIPAFQHPFSKDLAPYDDRLAMCRDAFSILSRVRVLDLERTLGGESKTLRTLQALRESEPRWNMRLLVGADVLAESHKWHRFDLVTEIAPPFVMGRDGCGAGHTGHVLPTMSSTDIRSAVRRGDIESLSKVLPRPVLTRILERKLYTM